MSNSSSFLKPQFIVVGVVLLALIGLSTGLKRQAEGPARSTETAGRTEFDRVDTGPTRIGRISAPSSNSSRGQSTAGRAPIQANQGPRKAIVENFETALRRAEGDSFIYGRVFGSDPDRGERELARLAPEDRNTSAARDRFGRRWSEQWDRPKAVASAKVLLYEDDPNTTHPPLRTAVTDEEGSFTIANINDANQRYIIVVKADNYAPEAEFVSVNAEPRQVYMRMEKGVALSGKVVDSETSASVAGAVVYHPNPHSDAFSVLGVTTTTVSGEFFFPAVHPGRLQTQASAEGYATAKVRLRAPDDKTIIEMNPGGASISGVTIDRITGKPQGGARVWATLDYEDIAESVISAADGSFTIKNLPEGEFDVYAVRGMKSEVQKVELERRQKIEDIEITLPAPMLVSGQVIHATKREPLAGIKVWYESSKGAQYKKTNSDGRFAFETMAIDEYAILIHEKGFLPVQEKRTTEALETLTRKVSKTQASDELVIRLRPVPTLEGNIITDSRRGGGESPAGDAEVKLAYLEGRDFTQLTTKSDPAGNFFFNLPQGGRGQGIVMASKNNMLDGKDVRVPRKNPVKLHLRRNFVVGRLLLSDESSLDGVPVDVSLWIPKERADSSSAHRVKLADMTTMRGGMVFMGLPRNQNIELSFSMPDGVVISKEFPSNRLLNSRPIFVYDPVAQDIVADTSPRQGRGRGGQRGGDGNNNGNGRQNGEGRRNGNGNGNGNGNRNRNNNGGQNQNNQQSPGQVQPAAAAAEPAAQL